jgi:hypothetical protein
MKGNVLSFDPIRGTSIINITAVSQVPEDASDIANAVAQRYKAIRDSEMAAKGGLGIESYTDQIKQQQAVVDDKQALVDKLRKVAADNGAEIAPDRNGEDRDEADLDSRKKDLLDAKERLDAETVLLKEVINLPDDQFVTTLIGLSQGEADIQNLRDQAFTKQSDIENLLKSGFDRNHPRVLSLQAELDKMQSQITGLIAGKRRAMAAEVDVDASQVTLLQNDVNSLTDRLREEQKRWPRFPNILPRRK